MTGIPDELVEKAARVIHAEGDPFARFDNALPQTQADYRRRAAATLEAIGLPALLERVEAAPVVHVAEIRLRLDDPWDVCDVGVYPIVGSLEATLADVANRLEAELDRTNETDRTKHVSRTLGSGLLRKVQVETIHREGESFFRHTVTQSDNQWLNGPRAVLTEGTEG